jgi:hypothetical protein
MTNRQFQPLLISGVVFGVAVAVLSQPCCQGACRAFFKRLETQAETTLASVLLAGLFGSAI